MDIDWKTALSERLSRIRALNRAIQTADLDMAEMDPKDIAHLHVMLDTEINTALQELEAPHA
jgi:hypothetical protein